MPANTKHLTSNKWNRISKVSAAILGGVLVTGSSMLALAAWYENPKLVFMTYFYAFFLLWCTLMLLAFLFKNGWQCWAVYIGVSIVLMMIYYAGTTY